MWGHVFLWTAVVLAAGDTPADTPAETPVETPEQAFQTKYAAELDRVRATATTEDDLLLAAQALEEARSFDDEARKACFCGKACEVAACDPKGLATLEEALKFLAELSPQKRAGAEERLIKACEAVGRLARRDDDRSAAHRLLVQSLLLSGDGKLALRRAPEAISLFTRACTTASAVGSPMRHNADVKLALAKAHLAAEQALAGLQNTVAKTPQDTNAARLLGMRYLVDLDDPEKAAPYIKDDDPKLPPMQAMLALALKPPEELEDATCWKLATWYRELAAKAATLGKIRALCRARRYCGAFLGKHTEPDAKQDAVRKAAEEITQELALIQGDLAGGWIDLLAVIDPRSVLLSMDSYLGSDVPGALAGEWSSSGVRALPYEPPAEYDLEASFTCKTVRSEVALICVLGDRQFAYVMGCDDNTVARVARFRESNIESNNTDRMVRLQPDHRYLLQIQVRKNHVQVFLDQAQILDYRTGGTRLETPRRFTVTNKRATGFGVHDDAATIHSFWLRPVGGNGRFTTEIVAIVEPK